MRILLLINLIFISIKIYGNEINNNDISTINNLGLPVIIVETDNHQEPTCEYIETPQGCIGNGITNAQKIPGRLKLLENGDTIYDSGDYIKNTSGITIKVRGNTSAYHDKKPFKIKLQKKADLLNRSNDIYKDKDWVLLKDEKMSLFQVIGMKISELIGMQWTPQYKYVNLILNGDYRGIYILTESVKRNPDCRLNVSETGYIIEYDAYWWNEDTYFDSSYFLNYTFKYPDSDDITAEQFSYIKNYMNQLELSIENGDYEKYIDINSFVCWLLAHDILGDWDCGGSNMFLTKYDDTDDSKIMMGNLWDFDTIEDTKDAWTSIHMWNEFYFNRLLSSSNKTFTKAYIQKYKEISSTLFNNIISFLDEYSFSKEAEAIDKSRILDSQRWNEEYKTISENINLSKQWFLQRKIWLDNAIDEMDITTYIKTINTTNDKDYKYDITGKRIIYPNRKSIYIYHGKKYLNK